tara:strand:+ start:748 stop:1263 length:516 start_codon:yes stop_codon:yes gene_type:complete
MIILLGPDNTGKSTLASELNSSSGSKIQHCNTDTVYSEYIAMLSDPIVQDTVFDRWFFCDIPYATVVRKEQQSKFSYQEVQIMNKFTSMYKPLILLCTNQAENFTEREQLSTQDQHAALLLDYRRVLCILQQPYTVYDWEKPFATPEKLLDMSANQPYKPGWLTYNENTPV